MRTHDDDELQLLLEAIHERYQHDFRQYSAASVRRRLQQALTELGVPSLAALRQQVLQGADVLPLLLRYLTVQVSDLFRDPAYWRVFRNDVVPVLRTYPTINVWIAGCATGEEAYSFAVLFAEAGLLDRCTLYATDINAEALRTAEGATYPLDRLPDFEANHAASGAPGPLADHYRTRNGSLTFDRALAKRMVFSDHSLVADAVFAEVQVVSCRNVLIYFDPPLQDRAVGLFRDALCMRGFLGLGAQERLRFSKHRAAFETFAEEERWYRRC